MRYELYVKGHELYILYGDSYGRIHNSGSLPPRYKTVEQFIRFLSQFGKVECTVHPENDKERRELIELFELRLY